MSNIYIDLGAYDGDTIKQFKNWGRLLADDWKIYGFDPNPRFEKQWEHIANDNVIIEQKAAWTYDGHVEFTLRPQDSPYGSTIMKNKVDWGQGETMLVECFDFSKWLSQFRKDFVIIKMDIEGAEFAILNKMIDDNTDNIPHKLFVEWHGSKLYPKRNTKDITDNLRCDFYGWY